MASHSALVRDWNKKHGFRLDKDIRYEDNARAHAVLESTSVILSAMAKDLEQPGIETAEKGDDRVYNAHLLIEEMSELVCAFVDKDVEGLFDAIGDLYYVLLGTAERYGVPLDEVMDRIHTSNMTRPLRTNDDPRMRRKTGFVPPQLKDLVKRYEETNDARYEV